MTSTTSGRSDFDGLRPDTPSAAEVYERYPYLRESQMFAARPECSQCDFVARSWGELVEHLDSEHPEEAS